MAVRRTEGRQGVSMTEVATNTRLDTRGRQSNDSGLTGGDDGRATKEEFRAALHEVCTDVAEKALRFDLDQAGIAQREKEAVELVELRAEVDRLRDKIKKQTQGANLGKLRPGSVFCCACLRHWANKATGKHGPSQKQITSCIEQQGKKVKGWNMRYCIGCLQEECACAEEAMVERRNKELEEEERKANRHRHKRSITSLARKVSMVHDKDKAIDTGLFVGPY